MTEDNDDGIWMDDESEAEPEESNWSRDDSFFDTVSQDGWEDGAGGWHELQYGEPEAEEAEYRTGFDTFEEAEAYIDEILTGADIYFDIFWDDETGQYEVYYMGGSD